MADEEATPNAITQLAALTTQLRLAHPTTARKLSAGFKAQAARAESEMWRQSYLELADMLSPL